MLTAVVVLAGTSLAADPFRFVAHGFGGTAGTPYYTNDGSGFYVHSDYDFGDGTPSLERPTASQISSAADAEWTSYVTEDALGPSRYAGDANNESDQFYLSHGVYPESFSSRSASVGLLIWGGRHDALPQRRRNVVDSGNLRADFYIASQPIPSGISPEGADLPGIFLARFTVHRGVTVHGSPQIFLGLPMAEGVNFRMNLDGAPYGDFALRSYLVAQPDILDPGMHPDEGGFGAADVYDVWLVHLDLAVPAPGAVSLLIGAGILYGRRRSR